MKYLIVLCLCMFHATTLATDYYVDVATGNNADDGLSEANAWADPGYAAQQISTAGHTVYVKAGTYTITTATPGAAGPVQTATGNINFRMEGYETTPGDKCPTGNLPVLSVDNTSMNPGAMTGIIRLDSQESGVQVVAYLRVDCNSETNTRGIWGDSDTFSIAVGCEAVEASDYGIYVMNATSCESSNNANGAFYVCNAFGCYATGNGNGFTFCVSSTNCIAYNNTNAGFFSGEVAHGCVAYGNSTDGFKSYKKAVNCISVGNTQDGYETAGVLINCADYNNTTGRDSSDTLWDLGAITLTGDPFTNAAAGDFSLNNTAGAGADLRAAGFDPYGQTGFADIGAVQHEDAGGGGGSVALPPIKLPQQ